MNAGWSVKVLGDVCEVARGTTITKKDTVAGTIPVVAGGLEPTYYHNKANRPAGSISISGSGANAGFINYWPVPIFASDCSTVVPRDPSKLDIRYVFLALKEQQDFIYRELRHGAAQPHVYAKDIMRLRIAVPSLCEQQRIVSILNEAFEAIATAKANVERSLRNARALLDNYLQTVFMEGGDRWIKKPLARLCDVKHGFAFKSEFFVASGKYVVLTPGNFYESGGYRDRGEKQKYYSGEIPHGYILSEGDLLVAMTEQAAGLLGSPILVPQSDKFLHNQRLGLVLKKPGVPWLNEFFFHVFNTEHVRKAIHASASGVKVRHTSPTKIGKVVVSFPASEAEQRAIVARLNSLTEETQRLESIYKRKLAALDELKKSLLHRAFSGELTASDSTVIPITTAAGNQRQKAERRLTPTDLHAGILALACRAHERAGRLSYFGHVKSEKIAHMVEAHLGIDLGRTPVKDAAGPNDYPHLKRVEHRARHAGFFDFQRHGSRYVVSPLRGFDRLVDRTRDDLGAQYEGVVRLIDLMVKMDTERAEVVATVYAAWNNLLLDGLPTTDEDIVRAAREDWHPDKLKIERDHFFKTIDWMRRKGLTPTGTGSRVADKPLKGKRTKKGR